MSGLDPIRAGPCQNITGATTLSVPLPTHFGTARQQDEIVSLRLKEKRDLVFVREFEIR